MNFGNVLSRHTSLLLAGGMALSGLTGCLQTTMGGQTLPSAYYLDDDVAYFPKGPETRLSNQIRAIERYKAQEASLNENYGE